MSNISNMSNMSIKLDGNELSNRIKEQLINNIKKLKESREYFVIPNLTAILVGDDPASKIYIKQKQKACQDVGINFVLHNLPNTITQSSLITLISNINNDPTVHGCIVQLPLPIHINKDIILSTVSIEKDVDCFHPQNIGNLLINRPKFLPATPYGIKLLLEHHNIPTKGKNCVIIGKSMIVGQPLANLMSIESDMAATVTICDKYTENLIEYTKKADILIVAAGKHHLINDINMIKKNVVIIDVGIHRILDDTKTKNGYRIEGDVNYDLLKEHCSYITPVPGGVGPMTVISLLLNTWTAYLNLVS